MTALMEKKIKKENNGTNVFRAERRNKHAQVFTVRQAPSLKKWRDFRRSSKQKRLRTLYAL